MVILRLFAFVGRNTPAMSTWRCSRSTCSLSASVEDAATCDSVTIHSWWIAEPFLSFKLTKTVYVRLKISTVHTQTIHRRALLYIYLHLCTLFYINSFFHFHQVDFWKLL